MTTANNTYTYIVTTKTRNVLYIAIERIKMKILYVTTIGSTMDFFKAFIRQLLDDGHTVDIATNEKDRKASDCYRDWHCKIYHIDTSRSPFNTGNIKAVRQIRDIVRENGYDIVHCHTPIASICTRLACRKARKHGTKVIYTAHGFHFYKGAPLKNWLLFYPAEKLCAHFTDTLITINQEDYNLARKKMKAKSIEYVPGVGVDTSKFANVEIDRDKKRQELDIPVDKKLLISIGELNENKNHETVIRALQDIKDVCYIVVGKGDKQQMLEKLIDDLDMSDRVFLLGYRQDIGELLKMSDLFVFPSYREGLSVSVMESMSSGLPVVCSNIRGNCDLIDENGGVLFDPHSVDDCKNAIVKALNRNMIDMGKYNQTKVNAFCYEKVHNKMKKLYSTVLEN